MAVLCSIGGAGFGVIKRGAVPIQPNRCARNPTRDDAEDETMGHSKKDWPIKGLRPAKSAAREAFEEVG
jgi:hypothetical protein